MGRAIQKNQISEIRRQLTLFLTKKKEVIECIRAKFNPEQYQLISAHVTLCREEELESFDKVIANIKSITIAKPVCIEFGKIQRFSDGKGVWLPTAGENKAFHELRKAVLKGVIKQLYHHDPHITLMHPRNSTCTNKIFNQLIQYRLPTKLEFNKISLIEQKLGGKWYTKEEFLISNTP
ncbi:MAG: 2'-5' RNA ligase family protein [Bacteroidota bacterium]|nr:2'-5' RNA ligase family protein [Bacteroidota bacterium]